MNLFSLIKDQVTILEVVSHYTTLKKAGSYYKGTCPFHSEKTASFTVSPDKQIFYCFGCHAGGDVISFIAKIENFSQMQAAHHLANQFGITLPDMPEYKNDQEIKNKHYELCGLVAHWCHENLKKNQSVIDYLLGRGVSKRSMVNFTLGSMPKERKLLDQLMEYLQKHNYLAQDLLEAKIFFNGKSGIYTPFEERIIFPIKDHLGRFCGFGGRVYKTDDERAKYYNSHDHQYFSKGSILFGLDMAKKAIQQQESAFLVEGYTDVISMVQHGYTNTIATLGTACTIEHLRIVARYAKKLYVVYDGDLAGQKAILRLTQLTWQAGLDCLVMQLPKSEDPASLLLQKKDLTPLINNAIDILTFHINYLTKDFAQKGMQDRLAISGQLIDMVKDITDPIKQDLLLKQIAATSGISFDSLRVSLRRAQGNYWHKPQPEPEQLPENDLTPNSLENFEKRLFSAILSRYEPLPEEDHEFLETVLSEKAKVLFKKVMHIKQANPNASTSDIFLLLTDEEMRVVSGLLLEHSSGLTLKSILTQWYRKQWKQMNHTIKLKIETAQKAGDIGQVKELLIELEELKKKMIQRGIA